MHYARFSAPRPSMKEGCHPEPATAHLLMLPGSVRCADRVAKPDGARRTLLTTCPCAEALRHSSLGCRRGLDPVGPHLEIALFYDDDRVTLSVTDDGTGFVESGDLLGFGLRGMRKRAAAVSATLEISSVPGNGTQISVVVPSQSAFGFSGVRHAMRHYLWEALIHAHSEK
jgi:hypothetical protein